MPIYEFQCRSGHVSEALVPRGTASIPCQQCSDYIDASERVPDAYRILSPTRTTFKFADTKLKS